MNAIVTGGRQKSDRYFKRTRTLCPVCNNQAAVRSSESITPMTRRLYLDCTNDECAMRFSAVISVERVITPSFQDPAFAGLAQPPKTAPG